MSKDERLSPAAAGTSEDAEDVLGHAFGGEGSGTTPEAGDGLELDAAQSAEVRSIFVTTLPQYLEPVEQMLQLRLSGRDDTDGALTTTLASLRTAASRIGADDILAGLERLSDEVAGLAPGEAPSPVERERVLSVLQEVRRIAAGAAGPAGASPEHGVTLFEVLRGGDEEDLEALERLTAAGLLTVEQVQMARSDEIAAVTGLDAKAVVRLLARIAAHGTDETAAETETETETEAAAETETETAAEAEAEAETEAETETETETETEGETEPAAEPEAEPEPVVLDARARLTEALRAQVEAEAALDEVWADVQRLRGRTAELRERLASAERRTEELSAAVATAEAAIAAQAATLDRLRARRVEIEAQRLAHRETVGQQEQRRADLRERQEAARREHASLERTVARLEDRLGKLLVRPRQSG